MKSHVKFLATALISGLVGAAIVTGASLPPVEAQNAEATDERIFMLNVLWFKEDGGAAKYQEYMAAAGPFAAKHGATAHPAYVPEQAMIGEFDADLFFVVEWPNMAAFLALVGDPEYQKISHLRDEAISDSLLIRCKLAG